MSKDYSKEIAKLIIETSKLTKRPITQNDFKIIHQPLNHTPKALPKDKMAVYTFIFNDEFLKIGQANKNSKARYQSHHYYIKSGKSTLANSLVNDFNMDSVNEQNVTDWIKANCERFDILIDASKFDKATLNFIEGLLHHNYNPRYEG